VLIGANQCTEVKIIKMALYENKAPFFMDILKTLMRNTYLCCAAKV
jgi:hypothetical protein